MKRWPQVGWYNTHKGRSGKWSWKSMLGLDGKGLKHQILGDFQQAGGTREGAAWRSCIIYFRIRQGWLRGLQGEYWRQEDHYQAAVRGQSLRQHGSVGVECMLNGTWQLVDSGRKEEKTTVPLAWIRNKRRTGLAEKNRTFETDIIYLYCIYPAAYWGRSQDTDLRVICSTRKLL